MAEKESLYSSSPFINQIDINFQWKVLAKENIRICITSPISLYEGAYISVCYVILQETKVHSIFKITTLKLQESFTCAGQIWEKRENNTQSGPIWQIK